MRWSVLWLGGLVLAFGAWPTFAQEEESREAEIKTLIRDLGADEFKTRQKADEELRSIGRAALPHLRKAVEDPDPERSARARDIIRDLENRSNEPSQPPGPRVHYQRREMGAGYELQESSNGVTLKVVKKDGEWTTYEAGSPEEFKEKYPELAKKYRIGEPQLRIERKPFHEDLFRDFWKRFRFQDDDEWGRLDPFEGPDDWFKKQMDRHRKWMEEFQRGFDHERRRVEEAPRFEKGPSKKASPRELGIRVAPVDETLREQLKLMEDEGVLVEDVKENSVAENLGLERGDIILSVNGVKAEDILKLRSEIRKALETDSLTLEVLRGGKKRTLGLKPERDF